MALPKKGTRLLTVAGKRYRWLVRGQPTYCQGAFTSRMYVGVESVAPASRSVLVLEASFARPDNWLGEPSRAVTPRMVATSIQEALAAGWNPEAGGFPFLHPLWEGLPADEMAGLPGAPGSGAI